MNKTLTAALIAATATITYSTGASAETECYTGWYQGAPIEVCLPTGVVPTSFDEPPLIHVSKDYVAPVVDEVVDEVLATVAAPERSGIAAANIPGIPKASALTP